MPCTTNGKADKKDTASKAAKTGDARKGLIVRESVSRDARLKKISHDFIWDVFCDWYIEIAKIRLQGDDEKAKDTAKSVLVYVLTDILKLLHPFMPFITEEIYQAIPHDCESIMISKWVEYDESLCFAENEAKMEILMSSAGRG